MTEKKIVRYYRQNFLYRSHTMMLPEMQEKNWYTCRDCRYFVTIVGKQENKSCCVRNIEPYGQQGKKISPQINIYEILKYVSPQQLVKLVEKNYAGKTACGDFRHRI